MRTLYVERDWNSAYNQLTILKDEEGRTKEIISNSNKQIRYNQKEYVLKGTVYSLNWERIIKNKNGKYHKTK